MQVIVISGKAQHGKDTTAGFLKDALEVDGYSVLIAHYGDLVKYVCKMYLGWNGEKDEYGRSLLQYAGTDVVRAQNENYWVQFVGDMLTFFKDKWDYVLIPDCRFPNEVNYLREVGFNTIHIRIIRDGFISPLTEQQQNHPSETALDNVQADTYFHNDGTLSDLREKVVRWVTEHNGHHQITLKKLSIKGGGRHVKDESE